MWWFIAYCIGALLTMRSIANLERRKPGFFTGCGGEHPAIWTIAVILFWWVAVVFYAGVCVRGLIDAKYRRRVEDFVADEDRKRRLRNG